ncbi:hypothetical protein EXM22_05915 [Oceanispirochaeta crateris]|uniref:Band 7 domain-containing protein n=1 Tax=Oceanispirochaeta crateris TaxID=2518645 RepID=A0A5C1QLX2_9SPIO|nr:hypothetical protein [Oceanispirochaeta crateris]QEN07546.1 hypothetical protein EXM22_05915 [Oceanispirochaeta crateris]
MTKKIKVKKEGKSRFKKFKNRLSFLIVLVFAAFVFYMGWIQIRIPEGVHALVYTKTGGYDNQLISPGQFVWRWENLFPGNMTLHFIELKNSREEYTMTGYLPSGELYGQYINRPEAFHYTFEVEYRFSIKDESFVSLIESGTYYSQLIEDRNQEYVAATNEIIQDFFKDQDSLNLEGISEAEKMLSLKISESDPRYQLNDLRIISYQYPDIELYEQTRAYFLEELAVLRQAELKTEQIQTELETVTSRKMDLLRQYGEVLSEFPVLLQYYGLDKEKIDPSLFQDFSQASESP